MSDLSLFDFNGNSVRSFVVDGTIWFVAKDVCDILELENVGQALKRLDEEEKGVILNDTLGGKQEMATISEQGFYSLALSSRKPQAKPFRKWVTSEVLPSIRKTGSYTIAPLTALELAKEQVRLHEALELQAMQIKLLEEDNLRQSEAIDELFEYSSIIRIAKFNNCGEKSFAWHKLKAASMAIDEEIKKVPCPRFGTKNLYSHDAWRVAYPWAKLPETTTLTIINHG